MIFSKKLFSFCLRLFLAWIKRWTTAKINEWLDISERIQLMIKLVNRSNKQKIELITKKVKTQLSHRKEKNSFPKPRNTGALTKTLHTFCSPSLSLVYSGCDSSHIFYKKAHKGLFHPDTDISHQEIKRRRRCRRNQYSSTTFPPVAKV